MFARCTIIQQEPTGQVCVATFVFPPQIPQGPRGNQPRAPVGIRPKLHRVTIRIQMSVLEASWILQPESEHSVEADVSDPDEGERKNRKAIRLERVDS